jgi:hypothetical protein
MKPTIVALALLLTAAGCRDRTPASPGQPSDLSATPTQVTVSGQTLTLEASLWRDFMPISPPDGKPLIVAARVKTLDGRAVPATLSADTLWVLNGSQVWSAPAREERPRAANPAVYEVVARDGPKWGPGIDVDVVLRLRDGARELYLRAPRQPIQGTY